jgi:hypothetical protein
LTMKHAYAIRSLPGWNAHVCCSLDIHVIVRPDGGQVEHIELLEKQSRLGGSKTMQHVH